MKRQLAGKGQPARRKIPMQPHPDYATFLLPALCRLDGPGIGRDWTGAVHLSFDNMGVLLRVSIGIHATQELVRCTRRYQCFR